VAPSTFLIEERLHGHPNLLELAPHTLCAARLTTITTLNGDVRVVETVMKLTAAASGVDNQIQGSVGVFVDPETGVMGTGHREFEPGYKRWETVPGTDKRFTGMRVPLWDEVMALAREAAAAFPDAHGVGWDIAIADRGPVILEGNAAHGQFQIECQKGLMQGEYKELIEELRRRGVGQ
jgi:hypothetical protein